MLQINIFEYYIKKKLFLTLASLWKTSHAAKKADEQTQFFQLAVKRIYFSPKTVTLSSKRTLTGHKKNCVVTAISVVYNAK